MYLFSTVVDTLAGSSAVQIDDLSQTHRSAMAFLPRRVKQVIHQNVTECIKRPLLHLRNGSERFTNTHLLFFFSGFCQMKLFKCSVIGYLIHVHGIVWYGVDKEFRVLAWLFDHCCCGFSLFRRRFGIT